MVNQPMPLKNMMNSKLVEVLHIIYNFDQNISNEGLFVYVLVVKYGCHFCVTLWDSYFWYRSEQ